MSLDLPFEWFFEVWRKRRRIETMEPNRMQLKSFVAMAEEGMNSKVKHFIADMASLMDDTRRKI